MKLGLFAGPAALVLGLCLSACGGDDGDPDRITLSTGTDGLAAPEPKEAVDAAAGRLAKALASGDCKARFAVGVHSAKRPPTVKAGSPPTRSECATLAGFARQFKGLVPGKSATFYSASVVDGEKGGKPVNSVFVLDEDGSWKHSSTTLPGSDHQVGTKPKKDDRFDASATTFVNAVIERDCADLWRSLSQASLFVTVRKGNRDRYCDDVNDAYDGKPRETMFSRVANDGVTKLVRLGQTLDYGFYGLQLGDGSYYTLITATDPIGVRESGQHERDGVMDYFVAKE